MALTDRFLAQHRFHAHHHAITRRFFLKAGISSAALGSLATSLLRADGTPQERAERITRFESYLTLPERFGDVSRGNPVPHTLSEEKRREVGLTRETWKLDVASDPEHAVRLRNPLSVANGKGFDFAQLMTLAEKHAVRFAKVMTCLNIGCPLGMGIWEGVPLRHVLSMTEPRDELRRIFYYGYHNDDPAQMFRSSLPVGRVLEDWYDLPPVILCYKLNGQWLSPERGGPVRIVVPEAYGFKSIKWLTHVVLSNLAQANDTYADQGNDVESPLKTFAATLSVPDAPTAGEPIPLTGYAQVGIGGLSRVQVWIQPEAEPTQPDDPHFASAPWRDVEILPAPEQWGGGLPDDRITDDTIGFDPVTHRPLTWPMKLASAHWATVHPALPAGKYTLRCRAIDGKGIAQPMPRPSRRSGHAAIEQVTLTVM